jgi:hypothetical protein
MSVQDGFVIYQTPGICSRTLYGKTRNMQYCLMKLLMISGVVSAKKVQPKQGAETVGSVSILARGLVSRIFAC